MVYVGYGRAKVTGEGLSYCVCAMVMVIIDSRHVDQSLTLVVETEDTISRI